MFEGTIEKEWSEGEQHYLRLALERLVAGLPREPKPPVDPKLVFGPSVKNHTIKIELLPETFLDFVEPFGTRFEPVEQIEDHFINLARISKAHRALTHKMEQGQRLSALKNDFGTYATQGSEYASFLRTLPEDAYRIMLLPFDGELYKGKSTEEKHALTAEYHQFLDEIGEPTLIFPDLRGVSDTNELHKLAKRIQDVSDMFENLNMALTNIDGGGDVAIWNYFHMNVNRRLVHDAYRYFRKHGLAAKNGGAEKTPRVAFISFVQNLRAAAVENDKSPKTICTEYFEFRTPFDRALSDLLSLIHKSGRRDEASFLVAYGDLEAGRSLITKSKLRKCSSEANSRLQKAGVERWTDFNNAKLALEGKVPLKS